MADYSLLRTGQLARKLTPVRSLASLGKTNHNEEEQRRASEESSGTRHSSQAEIRLSCSSKALCYSEKMRIAQVATLGTPVRQAGAGSIESLVWLLSSELIRMGHEVTVFGARGSTSAGEVVARLPTYGADGAPEDWQVCEWVNLCEAIQRSDEYDVVHSHNYLIGLPLEPLCRAPMLHTLHLTPGAETVRLRSLFPNAWVNGISHWQWSGYPELPPARVVHNAVDTSQFDFQPSPEGYLCYLGRFLPGKGPLAAIAVARSLGMRLILAGPRNDYFSDQIAPLIGGNIEYVGSIGGAERNRLLGGASVLVYPVRHPEPFGLVLPEAMICGTPVAAYGIGAVSEVVDEAITGHAVAPDGSLEQAVLKSLTLDRARVREHAVKRFSAARMAGEYADLYLHRLSHGA